VLDEELRTALADWVRPLAGLPVPDLQVLRRRVRRRRARRAAAGALVTAVAAAVAIGITVSLPGPARAPAVAAPQAAPGTWYPGRWFRAGPLPAPGALPGAAAPYVVTLGHGAAVVTDAFTGRAAGTVSPPAGSGFAGVAAAGDDHTFVFAAAGTASVGFYEERLAADGRPGLPVLVFALPGRTVPSFAVSPDASLLAYTTRTGIRVISLATGAGRSWTAGGGRATSLSWGGDRTLAFEWLPASSLVHAQVRLLDTAAPGTRLLAGPVLAAPCANPYGLVCVPMSPLMTPDGSKVFAIYLSNGKTDLVAQVEEFSARTGRRLAAITPTVSSPQGGVACQVLWSDPGGSRLMAFCGRAGVIAGGHFSPAALDLPAGVLSGALSGSGQDLAW